MSDLTHLEPIPPYEERSYHKAVLEALVGKERAECWTSFWMVCRPSFSAEHALILRREPDRPTTELIANRRQKQKWFLEVATAAQRIWLCKEYHPGPKDSIELTLLKDIQIERNRIEIEQTTAEKLNEVWTSVVRQTRYSRDRYGGFDGVSYEFYAVGYFGKTSSPKVGLPFMLVRLAAELANAVQSKSADQKALLDECLQNAKELQVESELADKQLPD